MHGLPPLCMGLHVPKKLVLDHPRFLHALQNICDEYKRALKRSVLLQGCLYICEHLADAGVCAAEHLR